MFQREPRLKTHATLLEALADSAMQSYVADNKEKTLDRLGRILKITRAIAMMYPDNINGRCQFRYNKRMRCHKPLFNGECVSHGTEGSVNQLTLEEVIE